MFAGSPVFRQLTDALHSTDGQNECRCSRVCACVCEHARTHICELEHAIEDAFFGTAGTAYATFVSCKDDKRCVGNTRGLVMVKPLVVMFGLSAAYQAFKISAHQDCICGLSLSYPNPCLSCNNMISKGPPRLLHDPHQRPCPARHPQTWTSRIRWTLSGGALLPQPATHCLGPQTLQNSRL